MEITAGAQRKVATHLKRVGDIFYHSMRFSADRMNDLMAVPTDISALAHRFFKLREQTLRIVALKIIRKQVVITTRPRPACILRHAIFYLRRQCQNPYCRIRPIIFKTRNQNNGAYADEKDSRKRQNRIHQFFGKETDWLSH